MFSIAAAMFSSGTSTKPNPRPSMIRADDAPNCSKASIRSASFAEKGRFPTNNLFVDNLVSPLALIRSAARHQVDRIRALPGGTTPDRARAGYPERNRYRARSVVPAVRFVFPVAILVVALIPLYQRPIPSPLVKHVDALSKAETLRARFTVQRGTYAPEEHTLVYSRRGNLKVESQQELLVWDGTKVIRFDKSKNEYSEVLGTSEAPRIYLQPRLWGWSAFFDRKPWEGIAPATQGAKRVVLGARVTEVIVRAGDPPEEYRLMVDDATGLVRAWTTKAGGEDLAVMAATIEASPDPADASEFAFSPPADAKKVEPEQRAAPSFADVQGLLRSRCMPCHSRGSRLGGHEFETFDGVMRAVKPGDPDGSLLIKVVSPPKPKMPQGGAHLSQEQVRLLRDWIAAGAKR